VIYIEAIRTYTNTKCELEMAKTRLSLLMDRKEQLYAKYFPVTQKIKDDVIKGGIRDNDKMAMYVHELNEVDIGTGRSLAQEIEYQRAVVDNIKRYVIEMSETLSKMRGIEYALYYEIVVNGVNTSKAVSNIAEKYNIADRNIWKYHYNKIKNDIKKLKNISESTVNILV
jgi:hypothetical protein